MEVELSAGALKQILNGTHVEKPIVQIMGHKIVAGGGERYRMLISDGVNCYPLAMVATQLKDRLLAGEFERYTVVKIDNYTCNSLQRDKVIMIILDLTVIATAEEVGHKIGEPQILPQGDSSTGQNTNETSAPPTNGFSHTSTAPSRHQAPTRTLPSSVTSSYAQPAKPNASSSSGGGTPGMNVHPISSLTPYQNKWTIRARVITKSSIRTWSNSRGEGKLFSMELVDESGEIRATAFTNECDKFYDMINVNEVYYISKAALKTANKQYTSVKNDYEMTFSGETTVVPCTDTVSSIPKQNFNFKSIADLQSVEPGQIVDIIAICKSSSDVVTITSRNSGKDFKKRDVQVVDKSNMEISLTFWDVQAETFDATDNPILAIKGCRVSDYGGRSLSLINSSSVLRNPDIHEAHVLRGWYERVGMNSASSSLTNKGERGAMGTNWKTFAQAKAEQLGSGERAEFYNCKATISIVKKDNAMYMACPKEGCSKKILDMQNGKYRCDKCDKEYNEFKWRLLLSVSLADFTDNMWVTTFQESGETIMGISAQELGQLKETNEDEYLVKLTSMAFKTYTFVLRAKMETFNEERRMKTVVSSVSQLDPLEYAKKLLKDIKEMEGSLKP